jgi:hypothetical protein
LENPFINLTAKLKLTFGFAGKGMNFWENHDSGEYLDLSKTVRTKERKYELLRE